MIDQGEFMKKKGRERRRGDARCSLINQTVGSNRDMFFKKGKEKLGLKGTKRIKTQR